MGRRRGAGLSVREPEQQGIVREVRATESREDGRREAGLDGGGKRGKKGSWGEGVEGMEEGGNGQGVSRHGAESVGLGLTCSGVRL